jgi:hypothetical protein
VNTSNNATQLNQTTQGKIMNNVNISNTKDNIATALVLLAVVVTMLSAVFNTKPAHAVVTMPVIQMEKIVVTAQREQILKLDTIVVTASRNSAI